MIGQPNLDTPLVCGLTPAEIIFCVIRDPHESGATVGTAINPDTFDIINMVDNPRTGHSVSVAYREEVVVQPDNSEETIGTYLCELKIGNTYVSGLWTINITFGGESEAEWARNRSEEAFMRAATLIGRRTERQIVVLD